MRLAQAFNEKNFYLWGLTNSHICTASQTATSYVFEFYKRFDHEQKTYTSANFSFLFFLDSFSLLPPLLKNTERSMDPTTTLAIPSGDQLFTRYKTGFPMVMKMEFPLRQVLLDPTPGY